MRTVAIDLEDCIDHGQVGTGGYGTTYIETEKGRLRRLAHRVVFETYYGYRPEVVMHLCDNPRCINVRHLEAGTWDKNNKDRALKGRSATSVPSRQRLTHDQVREIRNRYTGGHRNTPNPNGAVALGNEFGIDSRAIYQIVRRKSYKEVVA